MRRFGLVAVAASAGGVRALRTLFGGLPAEFAAPVVVVQHRAARVRGFLDHVLAASTALAVCEARDGDVLRAGQVYVCPPDQHVGIAPGSTLRLSDGPRVNYTRPSADLLFGSVAACYGPRALALVLTGRGRDGAAGAAQVRRGGGLVLVQDPATCESPGMPQAVLSGCGADFALPLEVLSHALVSLVMAPAVTSALFGIPPLPASA